MEIPIKRFDSTLPLPEYEDGAACFDLTCREDSVIPPHEIKLVPVNIALQIPSGYALMIYVRSSTPIRKKVILANSVGIVDPFYCGDRDEVLIELLNYTDQEVQIRRGDQLAQGMIIKPEPITWKEVKYMNQAGVGGYNTDWFSNP